MTHVPAVRDLQHRRRRGEASMMNGTGKPVTRPRVGWVVQVATPGPPATRDVAPDISGGPFSWPGVRGSTTGDAVDHAEPQQIGRPQLEHVCQVGHVLLWLLENGRGHF